LECRSGDCKRVTEWCGVENKKQEQNEIRPATRAIQEQEQLHHHDYVFWAFRKEEFSRFSHNTSHVSAADITLPSQVLDLMPILCHLFANNNNNNNKNQPSTRHIGYLHILTKEHTLTYDTSSLLCYHDEADDTSTASINLFGILCVQL
jgi:hypothetical protein